MTIFFRTYSNLYRLFFAILICSLFCIAYVLPQTIADKYNQGPQLGFWINVSILIAFSLVLMALKRSYKVRNNVYITDALFLLLLIIALLSRTKLQPSEIINNKVINLFCLFFLYRITSSIIRSGSKNRIFQKRVCFVILSVTIFTILVLSAHALLQHFTLFSSNNIYFDITGPYLNPARLANHLIVVLPCVFAACLFFPFKNKHTDKLKFCILLAFVVGLVTVGLTSCRAAWIGLSVSCVFIIFLKFKDRIYRYLLNYKAILFILSLALALGMLLYMLKPDSANGRLIIWKICSSIIPQHLFLGFGYGEFEHVYNLKQADYFSTHNITSEETMLADVIHYPYNIILQWILEIGLLGLIVSLGLFYRLLTFQNHSLPMLKYLYAAAAAGIIAGLICGLFSYPLDILPVLTIISIFSGVLAGISPNPAQFTKKLNRSCNLKITSIIFTVALLGTILYKASEQYAAYKKWYVLIKEPQNGKYFEECYPVLSNNEAFLEFYSNNLLAEEDYSKAVMILGDPSVNLNSPELLLNYGKALAALKRLEEAERSLRNAVFMVPNRFYSRYVLAQFYFDNAEYKQSHFWASSILSMTEKIPSNAVTVIKSNAKTIAKASILRLK